MRLTTRIVNNHLILLDLSFSLPFKKLIESQVNPYFVKGSTKEGPNSKFMKSISKVHKSIDDRTH